MALPNINVWSVDSANIFLSWQFVNKSTCATYNLYGSATYNGSYTKMLSGIGNVESPMTPGSILTKVVRTQFTIAPTQPYYFKITSVTKSGTESSLSASPFIGVDELGAIYRERWTDDDSPVYKNIAAVVSGTNFLVSIKDILGRDANYMTVSTSASVTMAINSQYNDTIALTSAAPFVLPRHSLRVDSLYFTGSATVTIFVSGD